MQLLLVAGNNDMPIDYIIPKENSDWIYFLWDLWGKALPPEAKEVRQTLNPKP